MGHGDLPVNLLWLRSVWGKWPRIRDTQEIGGSSITARRGGSELNMGVQMCKRSESGSHDGARNSCSCHLEQGNLDEMWQVVQRTPGVAIRKKHDEQRQEALGESERPSNGDLGHAFSTGMEIQLSG